MSWQILKGLKPFSSVEGQKLHGAKITHSTRGENNPQYTLVTYKKGSIQDKSQNSKGHKKKKGAIHDLRNVI